MIKYDKRWALFLDRDGVINRRLPGAYVRSWEDFEWLPGSLDAIVHLRQLFGRIFVVTNQQGIGKGLMSEKDLEVVHQRMQVEVAQAGGLIDAVYYCPDLSTKKNNCRKPHPAMGYQAKAAFPEIDFQHSVMVGDSISDIQFGQNLGMETVLITTKKEEAHLIESLTIDARFPGLAQWAASVLQ
jgi:histidinol-phosphate phosphatase family protein